jgi:putative DNA primase/helicase
MNERPTAPHGGDAAQDDGELVSPIVADAPPMPLAHFAWGKPSARWSYRNGSGASLFEVWRFDPVGERKQFLPVTLWRDASGALWWKWKGVPAPRPLYGLDKLTAADH